MASVTAIIPSIPPRRDRLALAIKSVLDQTHPVEAISVALDRHHEGSAITRTRALAAASTEWVAFLDDDDMWDPDHLESLLACAEETGAEYVYSYFRIPQEGVTDPQQLFGQPFDPQLPTPTTITTLVRTALAQSVGFVDEGGHPDWSCDDEYFTKGCVALGAKIVHLPKVTWSWNHWGYNTSGRGNRWTD